MVENYAFIDGQNLYLSTTKREHGHHWKVDLQKFRVYLKEKYGVVKAFYYMGCVIDTQRSL